MEAGSQARIGFLRCSTKSDEQAKLRLQVHSLRAVTYRLRNPGPVHKLDHGQSDEKHIAIGRRVSHRLVQTRENHDWLGLPVLFCAT